MSASGIDAIEIPGTAFAAILDAAAQTWPLECCGLLVGRREAGCARVARAVSAPNVAADRGHAFEVDPHVLLKTHRAAREAGDEVLGPFHSHPDGGAAPSATDAARANAAGECWLIVPVRAKGQVGDARAFVFDGAAFTEIALTVR